jgi:heme/copper-type cytochrome/quinol oxidase subunit 2
MNVLEFIKKLFTNLDFSVVGWLFIVAIAIACTFWAMSSVEKTKEDKKAENIISSIFSIIFSIILYVTALMFLSMYIYGAYLDSK